VDTFLRDNLDWLSRATNWAKFSATASLGLIHKGQLQQGRALMGPYLPRAGGSGAPACACLHLRPGAADRSVWPARSEPHWPS
jgi:hypothetical protein